MPYIKPSTDVRARTRVSQPEQAPLLSVVAYLTTSPPVVDASKYRSWIPDFDKPQKAATSLPAKTRAKRVNAKHMAVQALLEKGNSVKEIAEALDMDSGAVSCIKYALKRKQAQAMPVAAAVDVDVDSERAVPEVAVPATSPAPTPVCLPASPEPVRTHILDWKARFAAIKYPDPPAGCLPKKRPKKVKVMTAGQVRTSTYNVVHAGSNNTGMWVNSTAKEALRRAEQGKRDRAINCATPPVRTPSPFD